MAGRDAPYFHRSTLDELLLDLFKLPTLSSAFPISFRPIRMDYPRLNSLDATLAKNTGEKGSGSPKAIGAGGAHIKGL
jgi:hypothetical protein